MLTKPDWKDAPNWAKHLWVQESENRFAWSSSKRNKTKALWTTDEDTAEQRYHLWTECWDYVEARPK